MQNGSQTRSIESDGNSPRDVDVDFLYLDTATCTRCSDTDQALRQAIDLLTPVFDAAGIKLILQRIHVDSPAAAQRHHFEASPTIRVDGRDIAGPLLQSECESCGQACGCSGIQCRIWTYRGQEYTNAPNGLIVNAILAAAYQAASPEPPQAHGELPVNIQRFFGQAKGRATVGAACCG